MKKEKNKGITLIALVVTIIVLLILAGISVMMLTGQNGILSRSTEAKEKNEKERKKEEIILAITALRTDYHVEGSAGSFKDYIFNHEGSLRKELGTEDITFDKEQNTITYKNTIFSIDENGTPTIEGRIELNENTKILKLGGDPEEAILIATLFDIEGDISWESSENNIVSIKSNGTSATIKAIAEGKSLITASCNGKSTTCEVTVKIPKFDDYSWEEINALAKEIAKDSTINNRTSEVTKVIDGKRYTAKVGDEKGLYGMNHVRILGFNHDTLENGEEAYGDSTITKAGISFEFVNFTDSERQSLDEEGHTNYGGWGNSEIRRRLYDYNTVEGKKIIKKVKKEYISNPDETNVSISIDSAWLLSVTEIFGDLSNDYYPSNEGSQYKYYLDINPKLNSNNLKLAKETDFGENRGWWLRSLIKSNKWDFCWIDDMGGLRSNGCLLSCRLCTMLCNLK